MKKTGKYIKCNFCGQDVYKASWQIKKSKILFCSNKCYGKHRSKHIEPWNKGLIGYNKNYPRSIEWRKNISESLKGEKNHLWMGGCRINRKTDFEWKIWREKVFERDDFTCQYCGQVGGKLNAHHIKDYKNYTDLRYELSNGVTICEKCHYKTDTYGAKNIKKLQRSF